MKIASNLLKIALVALVFTSVPSHVLCSDSVQVEYNPVTANLTVKAEDAKLEGVLALVSHKTGVWIRIDPSIEKRITIALNDISLESVLLQLSRGLSHSMFYESLDNGSGLRLVGIEIVSNQSVSGRRADTRFLTDTTKDGSFFTNPGLRDNGSPPPDLGTHDHSTVDNAGIGSRPHIAPEQSSDMAISEFTPVAGDAVPAENAGDNIPIDSDTEQPAYTPNEKIVSPMGVTTTGNYAKGIFGTTQ
jgi:hypothetical protein